jgi:hypothetical protein
VSAYLIARLVSIVSRARGIANLSKFVPQLRGTLLLPGCGDWIQQERAQEVNQGMLDFVRRLWASTKSVRTAACEFLNVSSATLT